MYLPTFIVVLMVVIVQLQPIGKISYSPEVLTDCRESYDASEVSDYDMM